MPTAPIEDGQIAYADSVMNAFGHQFKNYSQLLFNAQHIGFSSKLNVATGSPNNKNILFHSTNDDAYFVNNMEWDNTNKYYKTIDLSSANLVYMDIYATDVTEATLTDSANNVITIPLDTGVWRMYSWKGSTNEAINRLFGLLFKELADGSSTPNGVTGLTQLRFSNATYQDKKVVWMKFVSLTGPNDAFLTGTLSATDTNTAYVLYDFVYAEHASAGATATSVLLSPFATTIHSNSVGGVGGTSQTDHRNTSTIHSVVSADGIKGDWNTTGGGSTQDGTISAIFVFSSSLTISKSTSGSGTFNLSNTITISATTPDTATYPLATSYVIFRTTSASTITNSISTWNTSIDGTSTFTANVSYDDGSNYTSASDATILRATPTGTTLRLKLQTVRTDLSKIDKIAENATSFNYY